MRTTVTKSKSHIGIHTCDDNGCLKYHLITKCHISNKHTYRMESFDVTGYIYKRTSVKRFSDLIDFVVSEFGYIDYRNMTSIVTGEII